MTKARPPVQILSKALFFFKKNLLALPLRDILAFLATPSETIKEVFDLALGLETQTERKQS